MAPGRDPLAPGVVVVQGPGMERWIAQSIARDYGVCANTAFPFPRDFLERVFRAIPDESLARSNSGWDVRNLTWRIAKRLEEGRDDPDFAPLARQLNAVDGDWRLVQLAHRIAILLDQYITYRNGEIRLRQPVVPSMLTTSEDMIYQDCLGYLMEPQTL